MCALFPIAEGLVGPNLDMQGTHFTWFPVSVTHDPYAAFQKQLHVIVFDTRDVHIYFFLKHIKGTEMVKIKCTIYLIKYICHWETHSTI